MYLIEKNIKWRPSNHYKNFFPLYPIFLVIFYTYLKIFYLLIKIIFKEIHMIHINLINLQIMIIW